jgi:hypothetical protein
MLTVVPPMTFGSAMSPRTPRGARPGRSGTSSDRTRLHLNARLVKEARQEIDRNLAALDRTATLVVRSSADTGRLHSVATVRFCCACVRLCVLCVCGVSYRAVHEADAAA